MLLDKIHKLSTGPIARTASTSFILRVINIILGFATVMMITGALGVNGYGIFAFILSAALLIAYLGRLGFDSLLVREIPIILSSTQSPSVGHLLKYSATVAVLITSVASLGFWTIQIRSNSVLELSDNLTFVYVIFLAPTIALTLLGQSALRGFQNSFALAPHFLISQLILFVGVVILSVTMEMTLVRLLLLQAVSWLAAAVSAWLMIAKKTTPKMPRSDISSSPAPYGKWNKSAILMLGSSVPLAVAGQLETVLLGSFTNAESVGHYALAFRFAQLLLLPTFAISIGLAPQLSILLAKEQSAKIANRMERVALFSLFGALACLPPVMLLGYWMLEFINVSIQLTLTPFAIIICGYFAGIIAGRPYDLIIMGGLEKLTAKLSVMLIALNLIGCALIIPSQGINGAALVTAISFTLHQWLFWAIAYRYFHIRTDVFYAVKLLFCRRTLTQP